MELYGEDMQFKETEVATFTLAVTSLRQKDQSDQTTFIGKSMQITKRQQVLQKCSKFSRFSLEKILEETSKAIEKV